MTKCPYLGISEVARRVRKMYIGVDGVARKVTRAYVGIDNVARLFYTSEFFMPKGISKSNVIAAYQFKAAKTLEDTKVDLTEHGYNLTYGSDVTWDQNNGLKSGTVVQSNLASVRDTIRTIIIYYGSYMNLDTESALIGSFLITQIGPPALSLFQRMYGSIHGGSEDPGTGPFGGNKMGSVLSRDDHYEQAGHSISSGTSCATSVYAPETAVYAGDISGNLWLDGSSIAYEPVYVSGWGENGGINVPTPYGLRPVLPMNTESRRVYIYAAAFYNVSLNDSQHAEVSRAMKEIKL